jgi:hypothetical protein
MAPAPLFAQGRGNVQIVPRDRVPPPRVGNSSIRGQVIDAATGAAIPRARVVVMVGSNRHVTMTNGDGQFAFDKIPAGTYAFTAEKSTYMPGALPERGRSLRRMRTPGISVGNGQTVDDVVIKMYKPGVIAGRVLDANGDVVDQAQITALRLTAGGRPQMRMSMGVNDLGEFRVSRLEPGNYVLMVSPRRVYEDAPVGEDIPQMPLPTYYPSAVSLEQAQPIAVGRGQTVTGIDIVLAEGQPAIVTGIVTRGDGEPLAPGGAFISARFAAREMAGMSQGGGSPVRPDGTFRMQLPPGDYILDTRASGGPTRGPETELFGNARVTAVSGSTQAVNIVLGRGASATGRVIFEGGEPPPTPAAMGPINVPMFAQDGFCRSGMAKVESDWRFTVEGLYGTCSAPPGLPGGWMLKAVMYNGENWLDTSVTFEAGQQYPNVQIVLTRERAELNFNVSDEKGQPTRDYVAIIFPANKEQWKVPSFGRVFTYLPPPLPPPDSPQAQRMTPNTLRQRFMPSRIGEFFVVALDDIDGDLYQDPAVLEKLSRYAQRVTLAFGHPAQVTLQRQTAADLLDR